MPYEQCKRLPVHFVRERRMGHQRLELRSEHEHTMLPAEVHRLFAKPIAHEVQDLFRPVPERERKHTDRDLDGAPHSNALNRTEQCLRVGVTPPPAPPATVDSSSNFFVVIDLTIEGDDIPPRSRLHRLMARSRQLHHS